MRVLRGILDEIDSATEMLTPNFGDCEVVRLQAERLSFPRFLAGQADRLQ